MGKNNSDESDFSKNEIPDLNSLKPFEFEPKTNTGDINSSSSDEEEGTEYKIKRKINSEWCECSAKAVVVLQNRFQVYKVIKKRLQNKCFPMKFTKFLRTTCLSFPVSFAKISKTPLFIEHLQ